MNGKLYWKNRLPFLLTNLVCMIALTVFLFVCGNSLSAVLLILIAWIVIVSVGLGLLIGNGNDRCKGSWI